MEVELKNKWVQALRSGDYKQTHATLKNEDGDRCVLGVLCDITGIPVQVYGSNQPAYTRLRELLGGHATVRRLWKKNDSRRLTFPELADWIEEHL